jgi:hypothetical protein
MSGSSRQRSLDDRVRGARLAIAAAYAVLGAALLWSRLYSLGHSFWTDEILMISGFVREGPREILAGPGLSHELLALLTWVTSTISGESEIAFRLWSAVPFVAGVVLVTTWLHRRLGALSGVLFLFLCVVSPLLLDITRQARGYGLAFLAMSALVVAALEAHWTGRSWTIVALCAAGVVGTWTLPQVGIAFLATAAVVSVDRRNRRATLIGLVVSIAAIVAWYAPHLGAVRSSSQVADGVHFRLPWVVTAPLDQILLPALLWIDGTVILAGVVWLPLVLLAIVVMAASPLLRERVTALVVCSGVIATVAVLWITDAYVIPRYISFLLAPLFILLATGAASILGRFTERRAALGAVVCVVVIAVLGLRFVELAPDVVALPREANRDAAEVIERHGSPAAVLTYMRNPQNLAFYLGRPVRNLQHAEIAATVCSKAARPVFYVMQPFALENASVPCLDRPGVEFHRFRQYARGDEMDVWYIPRRP